jgi:endo-1,4-beta-mannosidase
VKINDFSTGINYWPIDKAMYWWRNFSCQELRSDFSQIAKYGMKLVRIFLLWEDFQPYPDLISRTALNHLSTTADLAAEYDLKIIVTFFCGHMSGVNWMPYWMLEETKAPSRFPLFSLGSVQEAKIRNFYHDPLAREAQILQIREVCLTLKKHPAIWAYDLGNEASNCVMPKCHEEAREWLHIMSSAIKSCDPDSLVTLGLHAEDLEEDRLLRPQDAGPFCDFLTMHAYPFYLSWVKEPLDVLVLPFLGMLTAWLSDKPVLLSEFGIPSQPTIGPFYASPHESRVPLFTESQGASYYKKALSLLQQSAMLGAMAWCYGDYTPYLWDKAPLLQNPHERHFGLFRHDGSAKMAAAVLRTYKSYEGQASEYKQISSFFLEDWKRELYYEDPQSNLIKMFKQFRQENLL